MGPKFNTMKSIIYAVAIAFVLTSCSSTKHLTLSNQTETLKKDVGTLASDMMQGRETGTKGEEMAAAYLGSRMAQIGLQPKGDGSSFLQKYTRTVKANPHSTEPSPDDVLVEGKNVVGYLNTGAKYTVIIGAHYDHLGLGASGSLYFGKPAIHNGADDNASGVAMMLALAKELIQRKNKDYNYVFIAFSGEEKGLWGSNYFAKNPTVMLKDVSFMLNMDMVGRLNEERQLAIYGTGTSPVWNTIIDKLERPLFSIKKEASGVGPSDHTSFYLQDIPVLHFFTGQHENYHKPSDDVEFINWEGMQDIGSYILSLIASTNSKQKLAFTKTKSEKDETPDFKVTLGVMPDYLYDGKGMRIDGVREGRPAHAADIIKGDIVLKMGDQEVVDMMSYMRCLSIFSPGQTVDVVIKRGEKMMTKKVTF